jgi:glutathione transport system substrate-binding protein
VASPSIMQRYISMNVTQKPFDNPKVREAINYAINRQALVKVAFAGYATPATGVVPPSIAYAKLQPWPYDPAKARELLKEAGYPNGLAPRCGRRITTVPRRKCCSLPSSSWRRWALRRR